MLILSDQEHVKIYSLSISLLVEALKEFFKSCAILLENSLLLYEITSIILIEKQDDQIYWALNVRFSVRRLKKPTISLSSYSNG